MLKYWVFLESEYGYISYKGYYCLVIEMSVIPKLSSVTSSAFRKLAQAKGSGCTPCMVWKSHIQGQQPVRSGK